MFSRLDRAMSLSWHAVAVDSRVGIAFDLRLFADDLNSVPEDGIERFDWLAAVCLRRRCEPEWKHQPVHTATWMSMHSALTIGLEMRLQLRFSDQLARALCL